MRFDYLFIMSPIKIIWVTKLFNNWGWKRLQSKSHKNKDVAKCNLTNLNLNEQFVIVKHTKWKDGKIYTNKDDKDYSRITKKAIEDN